MLDYFQGDYLSKVVSLLSKKKRSPENVFTQLHTDKTDGRASLINLIRILHSAGTVEKTGKRFYYYNPHPSYPVKDILDLKDFKIFSVCVTISAIQCYFL